MAYTITTQGLAGHQLIGTSSTTQRHPIGSIVQATDPTYGSGEFIYLKGVASTAVGSLVTYNSTTGVTTLAAVPSSNIPMPIAVAMDDTGASEWGWYQISGQSIMAKTASICLVAGVAVGVKTVGLIASTGTGKEMLGAVVMATASAATGRTTVQVLINRPRLQGRIT